MIPRFNIKRIKNRLEGNTEWLDYVPPILNIEPYEYEGQYELYVIDPHGIDTDVLYAIGYLEDQPASLMPDGSNAKYVSTVDDTIFRYIVPLEEQDMDLQDGFVAKHLDLDEVFDDSGEAVEFDLLPFEGHSVSYIYPEGAVETQAGWILDEEEIFPERIFVKPADDSGLRYELVPIDDDPALYKLVAIHRSGGFFRIDHESFSFPLEPLEEHISFTATISPRMEYDGINYEFEDFADYGMTHLYYYPLLSRNGYQVLDWVNDWGGDGSFEWEPLEGLELDVTFFDFHTLRDAFYPASLQHRYIPDIPYRDFLETIKDLVEQGKIELEKKE